ncbi:deaminase [Micromonospora sp. NPDC049101]|uniref:deoxycytidylate deaminase n=1 Tax=Micromonospora sp. NPDC049101 TaxID=3155032 RepID=UPI0033C89E38
MIRLGWDDYFLAIAGTVALRADCSRRQVGAVVVRDNRIVSTGYNGAPPGGPSCLRGECPRGLSSVEPGSSYDTGPGSCVAVHAEGNAILYAGRDGCLGSTLYVTDEPCEGCTKLIRAAGISRVVWSDRSVN